MSVCCSAVMPDPYSGREGSPPMTGRAMAELSGWMKKAIDCLKYHFGVISFDHFPL